MRSIKSLVFDLLRVAPAVDELRRLVERGVDQMRCAAQFRGGTPAIRCAGQVDRYMTGTVEVARLPPGQGNDIAPARDAEVSQRGIADETARSGDHDFLARHARASLVFE
ncbi:hypothetical protein ACVWXL_006657 [Bradyrhizobium sp. GM22.5]